MELSCASTWMNVQVECISVIRMPCARIMSERIDANVGEDLRILEWRIVMNAKVCTNLFSFTLTVF